ncbi:hypothetical protein B0J18DRAFT_430386 [Chaetomium sp. MPI-SDFR-AT-0129]|nr:hypothetical protein B0J18DRAFT_430386 [Chaetomium sp. MPI-SDFR-AT-0129]
MPVRIPASATLVNIGNRQTCPTRTRIQLVSTNNPVFILGGIVPPPTRLSPRVPFASPAHQGHFHLHCHRTLSSKASNSSPMASHVSQPPAASPALAASTSPLPGSSSSAAAVVDAIEPVLAAGAAPGSPPGSNGDSSSTTTTSSPEKSGAGGAAPACADAAAAVTDAVSGASSSSSPAAAAPDTSRASWAASSAAAASQEETQPRATTVSDNTEAPNHAIPPAPAPPTSTGPPTATPLLPSPNDNINDESKPKEEGQEGGGQKTTTINLNGAPTALDSLGPMVIHKDGTISRIGNWHELSDIERENTLRILVKRNQARLKALRGEGAGGQGSEGVGGEKAE